MSNYHLNSRGYYTICEATIRSCPLKSAPHISPQEYVVLEAEGSAQILHNFTASDDSYFTKAKEEYELTVQREAASTKIEKEVFEYQQKLYAEAGLLDEAGKTTYYDHVQALTTTKKEALYLIKQAYVDAGVNPAKASFIVEDIAKQKKDIKPVIRKKDTRDAEIEAKTFQAVKTLEQDEQFNSLRAKYNEATTVIEKHSEILSKREAYRKKLVSEIGGAAGYVYRISSTDVEKAKTNMETAIAWKKAGVPDKAQKIETSKVQPELLSTGKDGKINNAWVQTDSGIERVVAYKPSPKGNVFGYSGSLVTDTGKQVSSSIHYHSYSKSVGGIDGVIISDKKGGAFQTKGPFSIQSIMDSGD